VLRITQYLSDADLDALNTDFSDILVDGKQDLGEAVGAVSAHHVFGIAIILVARRLTKKRQGHGIEQCRLPRTCWPRDGKNASAGEWFFGEIDNMLSAQRVQIAEFDAENFHQPMMRDGARM
jgi:hypothetical protein